MRVLCTWYDLFMKCQHINCMIINYDEWESSFVGRDGPKKGPKGAWAPLGPGKKKNLVGKVFLKKKKKRNWPPLS